MCDDIICIERGQRSDLQEIGSGINCRYDSVLVKGRFVKLGDQMMK